MLVFISHAFSLLYYRNISWYKSVATTFTKIHPKVSIMLSILPFVIIENAPYTSSFSAAMRIHKIIVTRFLHRGIKCWIERVTYIFICLMEMPGIFFKQIIRRKISATAKPSVYQHILFVIQFKHPVIAMYCRYKRIYWMNH